MNMLSRRQFIVGGTLVAGGAVTGIYLYQSNVKSLRKKAVNGVIESLAQLPGAVRFGKRYRRQLQINNKPMESIMSISKRLQNAYGDFNHETIGEALEQQIQIELNSNQIILVDSWYLTRSEAEICALASIANAG